MFETLRFCYGRDLAWKKWQSEKKLQLYLELREKYKFHIYGMDFVLIQLSDNDTFGVIALQKQRKIYEDAYGCSVGFIINQLNKRQMDSLISHRVPFICEPGQVFLPFMGLMLNTHLQKKYNVNADKRTPISQVLFLYLLYHADVHKIKSEIADELGVSRMSITRAARQLKEMNLITDDSGKLSSIASGMELYEKAKPYLINPVQKISTVRREDWNRHGELAGETALAEYSMLNPPGISTYAIAKNTEITSIEEVDAQWENVPLVNLQIWKYDPAFFAKNGIVDVISLACSLMDETDERIQMSIDEMLEEYKW